MPAPAHRRRRREFPGRTVSGSWFLPRLRGVAEGAGQTRRDVCTCSVPACSAPGLIIAEAAGPPRTTGAAGPVWGVPRQVPRGASDARRPLLPELLGKERRALGTASLGPSALSLHLAPRAHRGPAGGRAGARPCPAVGPGPPPSSRYQQRLRQEPPGGADPGVRGEGARVAVTG